MTDRELMQAAIALAREAAADGEVPVGAVVTRNGEIVSVGRNRREKDKNALAHAEIEAIDRACKALGGWRLWECELFVTLEPCPIMLVAGIAIRCYDGGPAFYRQVRCTKDKREFEIIKFRSMVVDPGMLIFGEVGLSGEVRGVSQAAQRVSEAIKMGFTSCLLPKSNLEKLKDEKRIRLIGVENVREAIQLRTWTKGHIFF